ncbi:MAG TPA: hypothetical protein VJ851_02555 [Jatrophihabitans sp.]|nr:hypothetical protein [Jatrophihabitans sp.]
MTEPADRLLEIRLFTLHPGTREEFHRISRDGTIPMMRRFDIEVIAFGPCLNNDDGYYLLRGFDSEEDRVVRSQAIYATEEWEQNYDKPVGDMIAGYQTAVLPRSAELLDRLVGSQVSHA